MTVLYDDIHECMMGYGEGIVCQRCVFELTFENIIARNISHSLPISMYKHIQHHTTLCCAIQYLIIISRDHSNNQSKVFL